MRLQRYHIAFYLMTYFLLFFCLTTSAKESPYRDSANTKVSSLNILLTPRKAPSYSEEVFLKNSPSHMNFTIENKTNSFIIVRGINIQGGLPDTNRWYGSRYGSASYDAPSDIWTYNETVQSLSKPIFTSAIIRPYGKYEIGRWIMPKTDTICFDVSYQKLSLKESLNDLYVAIDDEESFSLKHKFVHLKTIKAMNQKGLDMSFVIFPQADKIPLSEEHLLCKINLENPEFSFKEARKRIKGEILDKIFWKSMNMWVMKTHTAVYLVSEDNAQTLCPIDLLSFILIESSPQSVDCILPISGYEQFGAQGPHFEGPGYFNPGVTPISKEKIVSLFNHAKHRNDAVSVLVYDANGLNKRFYLLIGSFDKEARRKIAEGRNE